MCVSCCATTEDSYDQGTRRDREITAELLRDKEDSENAHKMLLLGPGNSGKREFFNVLEYLFCGQCDEKDGDVFKRNKIHSSIIEQMQMLLSKVQDDFEVDFSEPLSQYQGKEYLEKAAKQLANEDDDIADEPLDDAKTEEYQPSDEELRNAQILVEQSNLISNLANDAIFDKKIAEAIKIVWSDQRVKDVLDCIVTNGVAESCRYFFDDITRFVAEDYDASFEDILYARNSTVGIRHLEFSTEPDKFEIFDISGQRNKGSKWIHMFDNVRVMMYIFSLSCYDQVLFEDPTVNEMEESLELWDSICNSPYFAGEFCSLVVLANNKDLFQMKLKTTPLTIAFPDYAGENEYKPAYLYIIQEFEKKQMLFEHRTIYFHAIQAKDKNNVKRVMFDVTHNAVVSALHAKGIM